MQLVSEYEVRLILANTGRCYDIPCHYCPYRANESEWRLTSYGCRLDKDRKIRQLRAKEWLKLYVEELLVTEGSGV